LALEGLATATLLLLVIGNYPLNSGFFTGMKEQSGVVYKKALGSGEQNIGTAVEKGSPG
jgi:hypothetical protein